ncbi:hypothetical protein GCM10010169_15070 [Micromonospora fulviviridis]|nr:hypothetical protein GCM10010169_15070 [Micromonospora fulviviridis]
MESALEHDVAVRPQGNGHPRNIQPRAIYCPSEIDTHGPQLKPGARALRTSINGDRLDNRPSNLRLLCPNCHSQTATYAGRVRTQADAPALPDVSAQESSGDPSPDAEALIRKVSAGHVTTVEAAHLLGCTRDHVSRMRRRLDATGTIAPPPRVRDRPVRHRFRDSVIRFALAHPQAGSRKIASALTDASDAGAAISHRTVQEILREAGLTTPEARRSRLSRSAGVA